MLDCTVQIESMRLIKLCQVGWGRETTQEVKVLLTRANMIVMALMQQFGHVVKPARNCVLNYN